jgi:hypothetical protein
LLGSTVKFLPTDLVSRRVNRVHLTTGGHKPYLTVVESASGSEIRYVMLVRVYGKTSKKEETR